jgi:hypothetical protein
LDWKECFDVLDQSIHQRNEVVGIAGWHEHFRKCRCQNTTIPIIACSIEKLSEQLNDRAQSSLILWRELVHRGSEKFLELSRVHTI